MKLCNCPRCSFFTLATDSALALGDLDSALTFASEVTILDENGAILVAPASAADPSTEGYSSSWVPEVIEVN